MNRSWNRRSFSFIAAQARRVDAETQKEDFRFTVWEIKVAVPFLFPKEKRTSILCLLILHHNTLLQVVRWDREKHKIAAAAQKISDDDSVSNFIRFCWIATFHVWDHQHVSIPPLNTEHWNPPGPFSIHYSCPFLDFSIGCVVKLHQHHIVERAQNLR